jgi:hypothetical protein
VAREVPPEAYRRFKADARTRRAKGKQQRTTDLTIHDQKIAFVADWVTKHGTPDQRARHAAGVLPLAEVVQALADEAFGPLNDRALYVRDGASRLQQYLRDLPAYADVVVTPADLAVVSGNAEAATTDQWNLVQDFRAIVPDGDVKLRAHTLTLKHRPDAPSLTLFAVRVTRKVGPFTVHREFATCDDRAAAGGPHNQSLTVGNLQAIEESCMN